MDEYSTDTRTVLYDPVFATKQVTEMNAQQHTQATRDVLSTLQTPPQCSASHPLEWKGCKNIYCVRRCGPDGKHLKEDGSSGGRGGCALRAPPPDYCPPTGQPTFDEAKRVKKRKREESPSYGSDHGSCIKEEMCQPQGGASQDQATAAHQAATQAAQYQAAAAAQQAAAQAARPSEMETLRTAVERLQQENVRLSREINSLNEWKARMFAAVSRSPSCLPWR
jgi:hypothetical protein